MPLPSVHRQELEVSSALSRYYVTNFIPPDDVIDLLNDAGIRFMLVGLHGIAGWMDEGRATEDVDILVGTKHQKKAVKLLLERFPQLFAEDHEVVTRLRDQESKKVRIDVMKANQPLFREAFKYGYVVEANKKEYLIPCVELALAMKFAPMISLTRADKDKYQDAHDFMAIIEANPSLDLERAAELGELVYPGGGKELVEKIRQVRAGEKMNL